MAPISDTFSLAHQYHQAGSLAQAEYLYRQVLHSDPSHCDAWCFLAAACQAQGKPAEAEQAYRRALQLCPTYVEAHNNLGNTLMSLNRLDEAINEFQLALRLRPGFALVFNNLALAYERQHRLEDAMAQWHEALRLQPDFPEVLCNLGNAYQTTGKLDDAIAKYEEALRIRPAYPECLNNLANAYRNKWKLKEAIDCYQQALQLRPHFPEALCNLGATLEPQGSLDEAIQYYQQAIQLRPNYAEAHNNMGVALMSQGRLELAAASFRKAIQLRPDLQSAQSSYLLCVNYDLQADQDQVFEEHCRWGRRVTPSTPPAAFQNDRDPSRRLRVGYVSADFRFHALTRYFEPVLAAHDPESVETFCYAEVVHPDAITERLKKHAQHWRSTCGVSDAQIADMIRTDRIDILVDLAGHTAATRLRLFGLKPAPVQASWLGYLNTTGLTTMDYRITDNVLDPQGEVVRGTEELMRLPGGFCCFAPPADAPAVTTLPALKNGFLTFGSLHNLFKLNSRVFDHWSDVLKAVPSAKLLMNRDTLAGTAKQRIEKEFAQRGIGAERLDLRRAEDARTYMKIYEEIDVCLDVFPWSGGVIACESLWMGVPVLSLRGDRPAARNSASLLTRVGLSEWVAESSQQFVGFARELPNNLDRIAEIRSGLRDRMTSTICDAKRLTRELEEAYRKMWQRWCESSPMTSSAKPQDKTQEAELANDRGIQLAQQGRVEESKTEFERALSIKPDYVNPRVNLALAFVRQGRLDEAIAHYQQAIQHHSEHPEAHYHLGFALQQQGKLEEAAKCYREAVRLKPDHVEARNNLGIALRDLGDLDEASESYRVALELNPNHVDARINQAIVLMDQGQVEKAAEGFRQGLRLNPNLADGHSGLGVALTTLGRLDEALPSFDQALRLDPNHADAHVNRAVIWLLRGRWREAWPDYEWRWRTKAVPRLQFAKPCWEGGSITGRTIIVAAEQGLGDTLQFMRYLPLIEERGGKPILQCQPALERLLADVLGPKKVLAKGAPLPDYDLYAPLVSLPRLFGTTPANVPARVPYIQADPKLVAHWQNELKSLDGFRIGVAWQGSPKNRLDRQRSFPLLNLAPVAAIPDVRLVSLQKGPGEDQIQSLAGRFPMIELDGSFDKENGAFRDTAAVMMNLDLIITADTAVAHLAGALGVPTWLALPLVPDWRWLLNREDTPWYPTMRLFRQSRLGQWQDVFERMAAQIPAQMQRRNK